MLNEKPVISNQHGALAMAFLPYFYAVIQAKEYNWSLFLFGLAWLFLYLFSYPFFQLFSKKPTSKNQRWAIIYFVLSLIFALPVMIILPQVLLFVLPLLPLGLVQFYFAKKRDERNLLNDTASILTFGIVGMAAVSMKDGLVKLLKGDSLTRGISVVIDENNLIEIDFHVIISYGVSIAAVADNLIENVKYKVSEFTGLEIKKINIYVEGVRVID